MGFTLQPATKEDFIDREDILEEMLHTLTDKKVRMGYALVGPRRIGKTSIFKEVSRRLNQRKDIVAVYFSLWNLIENTAVKFCNQITISIIEATKKRLSLKYKIQHILKTPRDICRITGSNSNVVSRYIEYFIFIDKGILSKQDKGLYEFTDPVFKTWLRKKYMPTIL